MWKGNGHPKMVQYRLCSMRSATKLIFTRKIDVWQWNTNEQPKSFNFIRLKINDSSNTQSKRLCCCRLTPLSRHFSPSIYFSVVSFVCAFAILSFGEFNVSPTKAFYSQLISFGSFCLHSTAKLVALALSRLIVMLNGKLEYTDTSHWCRL